MCSNYIPFSDNNETDRCVSINLDDDNEIITDNICDNTCYDYESTTIVTSKTGILKHQCEDELTQFRIYISIKARKHLAIIAALAYVPIVVCNIYYIVNDNRCLLYNHFYKINFRVYLIVDTSSSILTICVIIMFITCYEKTSNKITNKCYNIYSHCYFAFCIMWIIVGNILFWLYTDKNICNKNVYTYVYVLVIMESIIHTLNIWRYINIYGNKSLSTVVLTQNNRCKTIPTINRPINVYK